MNFYLLDTMGEPDEDLCLLDNFVEGIDRYSWRIQRGVPLASDWPVDAKIFMSLDMPGIKLASLIGNTESMLVVVKELKDVIQEHCRNDIEYLPFTLYDHRKRVRSRDYFIINPIGTQDCLDLQASTIVWDENDPTNVIAVNKHVLQRDKVSDAPPLFRINKDSSEYLVRTDLAQAIYKGGFTNILWRKLPFNS
ncbi:hypothetical protein HUW63_10970 [Myxococcus sp. AM001]|nr:hypothetical protein [Myxococcus sp. AM001]